MTLQWLNTQPGIWRSTCGRYAIVAHTLPENPPRTMYQARRIDPSMAQAYPDSGNLGHLLAECHWLWASENDVASAESACERNRWQLDRPGVFNVPADHPAVALAPFWWPTGGGGRGALAVIWREGRLVAQLVGMSRVDDERAEVSEYTCIDLTELGVAADPEQLPTTTDHGPGPCRSCGARVGSAHREHCSVACCLVTGDQRLICTYFGGSPTAGVEAVATGNQEEFEEFFRTPVGHDCGSDIWRGDQS